MTDNEILDLVEEHFVELNPFSGFIEKEYAGKLDHFLKFARQIYDKGHSEGRIIGFNERHTYELTGELESYKNFACTHIVCDETNNTQEDNDANRINVDIYGYLNKTQITPKSE